MLPGYKLCFDSHKHFGNRNFVANPRMDNLSRYYPKAEISGRLWQSKISSKPGTSLTGHMLVKNEDALR
jgi:hypothetical protein